MFNEGLCDAMGLSLLKRFAQYNPDLINAEALFNFEKAFTSMHRIIINAILDVKENPRKTNHVFSKLKTQVSDYTVYSLFLKDRYAGPINNAWLLKNKYYSASYFYCRMFTHYPSTKITTQLLRKTFAKEKNPSFQSMIDKDLYLFMDN
jgi:hypothetical protein